MINLKQFAKNIPLHKTSWEEYFFTLALAGTLRADCTRRQVGCVLVCPNNRVVATGYNSPAKGELSPVQEFYKEHTCRPPEGFPCCKKNNEPANSSYDACSSIHAEMNSILQLGVNNHYEYVDMYLVGRNGQTGEIVDIFPPCIYCSRFIKNSNVRHIYYLKEDGTYSTGYPKDLKTTI